MRRALLIIIGLLHISGIKIYAYDFKVDGLCYNKLSEKTVELTWEALNTPYTGDIVVPKNVTYNGKQYDVVAIGDHAMVTVFSIGNSGVSGRGGNKGLTSITIPNSVTSIGNGAFYNCSGLTSITIPNSVTSIGYAFYGCSGLTSITVSDGNPKYDSRNNCNAIIETSSNALITGCKNTVIPNSVTSIGYDAFSGCNGLTSITIPNSVTNIGNYAFYYCSGLTSIMIPNSVTSIGDDAFSGCSGLTSITIPNSVTSIGKYAFWRCSGLTSISIPNSVTSIGNYAFSDCSALTDVISEIQYPFAISENVFSWDTYKKGALTVPAGTKSAYQATYYWNKFSNIIEGSAENDSDKPIQFADAEVKRICVMYWDTNGDGELSYKEAADVTSFGHSWYLKNINSFDEAQFFTGVTSIGNDAFGSCSSLTSITIPNSVTTIGEYAFSNCSSLSSITIPNSVTSIGDWSFYNCTSLTSVILSNSMTKIPDYAFWGCRALTSVIIPNSVTSIGNNVFENCVALTSFTIPNSITSIGHEAFRDCSSLTSIEIPNSVINIESSAFAGCSSLVSIIVDSDNFVYDSRENCNAIIRTADNKLLLGCKNTVIPKSVNSIGPWAFFGCSGLTSIAIPNSVTNIEDRAFYGCSGLTSITIPNSITSIGDYAFYGCSGLTSIFIPNSVTTIGYGAFNDCGSLESIMVESGNTVYDSRNNCNAIIETSPNGIVRGCKNTVIPETVTFIESVAFSGCTNLTSITIPHSVTSIDDYAFSGCTNLMNIISEIGLPFYIGKEVFPSTIYANATLKVPSGTKSAYLSQSSWNEFANIIESESDMRIIHIMTAGTLSDFITESEKYSIEKLTIKGKLNAKDFQLICDMAGRDNKGQSTLGKLRVLDLSDAELVVGGEMFVNTDMIQWIKSGLFVSLHLNCACLIDNPYAIPECLFGGCTSLVEITLPKSITSIGEYSFIGCIRLSNIHIPNNVNAIGLAAFSDTAWLDKQPDGIVYAGKVAYCYKGEMPQNTSIDLAEGTAGIAGIAFRGYKNLLSINIPNSVITIGDQAFSGCSSLSSLTISNGLTSIGSNAFANTPWESTLLEKHPDGFVYLGNVVYHYKGEMPPNTSVKLREGTIGIASGAFDNCNNMTSLTIPSSVISINHRAYSNAFSDCNNLSEITVEPGNNYYMSISGVLFDKNGTKLIHYPRGKTETLYEVPEKVTIIDEMAFKKCGNLTTVILPNSVFAISLFSFQGCNSLTSLRLPDSLISVCQYSFLGCHGIKETVIPNSVKYIGTQSIQSANLSSITLPQYEISIAVNAFEGCSAIKTVISKNATPSEINKNIFPSATYSNATLFVPSGTKPLYQSTNYWNMFNNIKERDTEIVIGDTNGDGSINVADIVEVVNCIMGKPSEKFLEEAADLTGDGIVNVADIVKLVSLVMGQSNSRQSMATAEAMTNNDQLALTENVDYTLSLLLTNEGSYTASQFDIKLAEGQTLERVELNRQRAADHHLVYTQTGRNTYRVMIYSMSNSFYEGNEGELLKIYASDGRIEVDNILFITNTQQEKHFLPLNNNTTGIDNSKLIIDNSYPVFDLQGRRVTNGQWNKGVYIKKGKKHINR